VVKREETFSALHRAVLWSARLYGIWQIRYENNKIPAVQCLHMSPRFSVLFPSLPLTNREKMAHSRRAQTLSWQWTTRKPVTASWYECGTYNYRNKKQPFRMKLSFSLDTLQRHPSSNIGVSSWKLSSRGMPTALASNLRELTLWITSGVTRSEEETCSVS
jgi:hypothetical protein